MRKMLVITLITLVMGTVPLTAQPADGDLIISGTAANREAILVNRSNQSWSTLFRTMLNQTNTTLGPLSTLYTVRHVRMGALNKDLVFGITKRVSIPTQSGPTWIQTGGLDSFSVSSNVLSPLAGNVGGMPVFQLDGDRTWLVAGSDEAFAPFQGLSRTTRLLAAGGRTFYSRTTISDVLTCAAIDRDPGSTPFVVGGFRGLFKASESGLIGTLTTASITAVDVDPVSGHYLVLLPQGAVHLRDKQGAILYTILATSGLGLCVNNDRTAWITASGGAFKVDLATGSVTTMFSGPTGPGIAVYGSRRLACAGLGRPGATVSVRLQSRKPNDAGKPYVLACSLARRPGLSLSSGAWLNLDITDPMFFLTAMNRAPTIFKNFRGTTNVAGNAFASVNIPSSFPSNTNLTVFVAGVILDPTGAIQTVTNTHWFRIV